jgi:26S proteasome regulatory subunit N13
MIPGDGTFAPYTGSEPSASPDNVKSPTNGRIYILKFSSSSQRYIFWMQSKSQSPQGDPSWFSPRDQKLGQIVDMLLSGEDINLQDEIQELKNIRPDQPDDDDETMEDVEGTDHSRTRDRQGSTGGAGPDATGGDVREEGEESREGGADGGRA